MPSAVPGLRARAPNLPDAPSDLSGWYATVDKAGEPTARRVLASDLATGGTPDGMIKNDGTTPFLAAQSGVAGTLAAHLIIKSQLDTVSGVANAASSAAAAAQADADAAEAAAATAQSAATAAQSTATAAQSAATAAQTTANAAVPKAGGTMTGLLVLSGPASAGGNPVRKTEHDADITTLQGADTTLTAAAAAAQTTANAALPKAGGTMTGDIVLAGAASAAGHPVRKQEFDLIPWSLRAWLPPTTLPAVRVYGAGGSTPVEQYPLWQFSSGVQSHVDCLGLVPSSYPGNGAVITLWFFGMTGVAGNMLVSAAGRRLAGGSISAAGSYSYPSNVNLACPTIDVPVMITVTLTHAQLGSPSAGDPILIRVRREGGTDAIAQHAALMAFATKVING